MISASRLFHPLILLVLISALSSFASLSSAEADDSNLPAPPSPPEGPLLNPENTSKVRRLNQPIYERVRPTWGFELTVGQPFASFAPSFMPDYVIPSNTSSYVGYAPSLRIEYQPAFIQSIGVLGIGYSATSYILTGFSNSWLSLYGSGVQLRYQARFFNEQILVPEAAFSVQYVGYNFATATNQLTGALWATETQLGLWFLLNKLEPSATNDGFIETGILRTYLTSEVHLPNGSDGNINLSSPSLFFGLRIEI